MKKTPKFEPLTVALDDISGYNINILNSKEEVVAYVVPDIKEESEATAILLAAAPELLAALGNFLTIIECNPELLESPCFKAAHDYANKVIKKALEG